MPTLKSNNKHIGITLGDPAGIGCEVTAKALNTLTIPRHATISIYGPIPNFTKFFKKKTSQVQLIDCSFNLRNLKIGKSNSTCGKASLAYLDQAIRDIKNKTLNGLVTAPICKESIMKTLPDFQGHTEYLAKQFKIKEVGMFFVSPQLKTLVVTRHIPLNAVSATLSTPLIFKNIELTYTALKKQFKIRSPRIGLCGLNPHASENGTIGKEEKRIIKPAIQKAQKKGIKAIGPLPADTLFAPETSKGFDAIIAMYHDQGLIPVKTVAFDKLVNMTIGLPFVRTSPAHGTAFDIAGKNKANYASMQEAITLALQLS